MNEQLRAKPKRCVRSACAFGGNTDGVQPFLCAVQSAKWRALVSTLGHFLWTPPLWKACQLNWQREARHFSSPKQTDNCCWYHANNPGSSQTGWTPEEPRVSAVTHTHTHTHTQVNRPFICFLHPTRPGLAVRLSQLPPTWHMPVKTQTGRPASADEPAQEFQVFLLSWKPPTTI